MVNKILQLLGAVLLLVIFMCGGVILKWSPMSPRARRKVRIYFTHYLARMLSWCIRLKINFRTEAEHGIGKLVVANHVSVLDAILLAARAPCVFVTSTETEENPVLEFLARTGGAIFIERRSRLRITYDQEQIRSVLRDGFDVVLFPEGTSTNGEQVLRFKSGLFPAALSVQAPIEPVAISYLQLGEDPIHPGNRDQVCYYGDHLIHEHLFKIFTNCPLKAEIKGLGLVRTHAATDAKTLAEECRVKIAAAFQSTCSRTASVKKVAPTFLIDTVS